MKRRTANKILNSAFHFEWYYNGVFCSAAPKHRALYFKAHRKLKSKPYYDPEWLKDIDALKKKYGTVSLTQPEKKIHYKFFRKKP